MPSAPISLQRVSETCAKVAVSLLGHQTLLTADLWPSQIEELSEPGCVLSMKPVRPAPATLDLLHLERWASTLGPGARGSQAVQLAKHQDVEPLTRLPTDGRVLEYMGLPEVQGLLLHTGRP